MVVAIVTFGYTAYAINEEGPKMEMLEKNVETTNKYSRRKGDPAHIVEDRSVADELAKQVRVLCFVMTQPENHEKKARHVKATWGKRCNVLLFMSSTEDKSLPSVKLPVHEGRRNLWAKTKAAFRYVYKHHRRDADWFMKAEDNTYVVVENLRYMLADYSSSDLIYFGCKYKSSYSNEGYMRGGAGYVLSRAALDKFVQIALPSPHLCKSGDSKAEDAEMGKCLINIGVTAMDSRDALKRDRFFPYLPQDRLFPLTMETWYWSDLYYPTDVGLDCCSDHAVSFGYISIKYMYEMDYLLYHLRPFGINFKSSELQKYIERERDKQ